MMGLPKYFDHLQLAISAITGKPRIAYIDPKKPNESSKYKNIPDEEWLNVILTWLNMFKNGNAVVQVTNNYGFLIGGKTSSREELINYLNAVVKQLEQDLPEEPKNE